MAPRRLRGWLPLVMLVTACKGDPAATQTGSGSGSASGAPDRCERLGKLCGDKAKHVDKITEECRAAAKTQPASCAAKVTATYDCYEKDLCATGDKVWTLDDLRVLAERHNKCVAERTASQACK